MGTIRSIQWGMGYVPANARPACRTCCHARRPERQTWWWCDEGGFMTSGYAICERHAQDGVVQAPSPATGGAHAR